ncbi:hypothetical protein FNV43_RR12854 [Rhamnella rubrinervis]|uniref:Uncharacterized protein n=1 Tax=Rhamnella rubrinervis TaxID=2594499 RepID=A0A8K0H042_9ROSA|nr:hypothetical protein FNV43_RR12854 [Rhamnella rubrinervis]
MVNLVYPYVQITFHEYTGERFNRSEVYGAIRTYLGACPSTLAKRLRAHDIKDNKSLILSMDDDEEITEEFQGAKLWWTSSSGDVSEAGNGPEKKEEIINDLDKFRLGKDYYSKIGKAWKRGYLLYGPGNGKSSMIAAMANYLEYDIYDLELTAVKDNTDLKKLLIDTSNKSIIMVFGLLVGIQSACYNYLDIDSHHLFEKIKCLLEETDMTPADVAENLMPKSVTEDAETCLKKLIEALELAKEEAKEG